LRREKQLQSVANRAQDYANEALAWLVDDGVASSVEVQATFDPTGVNSGRLQLAVQINRPNQPPFIREYQYVWSALNAIR
jgi:phage gp46-like protein